MSPQHIVPCLWLNDQPEVAAEFYVKTFPRSHIIGASHYPESMDNPGGKPRGSVLTVEFEIAGRRFTALNGGPQFKMNPSISFFVEVDSPEEADKLFSILAEGGKVLMPIDKYPWSPRYGWAQDRFGASWQLMTRQSAHGVVTIAPCLMFSDAQHGKAEEAAQTYTRIFPGGCIDVLKRYEAGEGSEGTIKHGRLVLAGQDLIVMDSHIEHGFAFNEGISLQVMCKSQAEIDCYWEALSEGGQKSVCGWLKDRFGLSWQVVPTEISQWLTSKDVAARDRAFAAVMKMKKLDVGAIHTAFAGR